MPTVNDANGQPWKIGEHGFGLVYSAAMTLAAHAADDGNAYTVIYNIDPNVAGDFLYIKNTSDKLLRINKIKGLAITTGGIITVKLGCTGTPTTGIALTPVNALVGSGNAAEGTFNRNTSTASMALTGGSTYDILQLKSSAVETTWEYPNEITLAKNQTFVLNNATDPTSIMTFVISFYYHDKVE